MGLRLIVALFANLPNTEDGKELNLDCETLGIKGIIEEVDRHSRTLQKQADLSEG